MLCVFVTAHGANDVPANNLEKPPRRALSEPDPAPVGQTEAMAAAPSIGSLDQRIARLENTAGRIQQGVQRSAIQDDDRQRAWIARTIIWIFVTVVVAGLAILVAEGAVTGKWAEASQQATDLIKSTVLPVVTLVLGYYFGRSGKG
jgi:hypothetical protein